jgi:hypothetical protein
MTGPASDQLQPKRRPQPRQRSSPRAITPPQAGQAFDSASRSIVASALARAVSGRPSSQRCSSARCAAGRSGPATASHSFVPQPLEQAPGGGRCLRDSIPRACR